MSVLTVKLPSALEQRLSSVAKRRGVSRSHLVREALEQSLNVADSSHETPSCLDLARDLVGSFAGPRTLSHDKKHLKGYGK